MGVPDEVLNQVRYRMDMSGEKWGTAPEEVEQGTALRYKNEGSS